jgi:hypothetical protein
MNNHLFDTYYAHYKEGKVYRLITHGMHSETQEQVVIYQQYLDKRVYARPYDQFFGLALGEVGRSTFSEQIVNDPRRFRPLTGKEAWSARLKFWLLDARYFVNRYWTKFTFWWQWRRIAA